MSGRGNLWLRLLAVALLSAPLARPDGPVPADSANRNLDSLTLEQLMDLQVESAALHPQTLQDAPASVTIVTAEDIRKYGYRTLSEALSNVRGFYVTNDLSYENLGVRGFDLPGDYNSHVLILVNGHNMADNIFGYVLTLGDDFPIELNLIKQIEIIRGPSSALYGSNAVFATINIITKSPDEAGPLTLTADTGSFGEKKGQIMESASLGGVKVLFSGTVFNNSGQSPLFFPQYDNPQNNYGEAINMNTERGYRFFSTLVWRKWTVTAAFAGHDLIQPISWGPTIFNDRGTKNNDQRNFVDADYQRPIAGGGLEWRLYYDSSFYKGRGDYALGEGVVEDNRQSEIGNWVGTQLTYRVRPFFAGDVTLRAESNVDIRAFLTDYDVSPAPALYLSTNHPDRSVALMFQDEKKLSKRWKLDLGLRADKSHIHPDFVAPRAALIYERSPWTYKFLYGRSFRNPSAFQLFYGDGIADAADPTLRPESADTVEIDADRKLGKRMKLQASAYGYELHDFVLGVYLPNGLLQYQNTGNIQAEGVEFEINGRPTKWLETTASYAWQRSRNHSSGGILDNSPQNLAKLRFAVPLGRRFDLSSGMQYESARETLARNFVTPLYLADFTLSSKHLLRNFDIRAGLRNAFNRNYSDPIALNPIVDSMPQPGRTFFVELIAHRAK
ncbi:MAG TPA: TonB-dependent receptor [Bryobacteraceae bacterium]|jgi:iron complex outermembrane receptor protein